jgi:hypothetical protein
MMVNYNTDAFVGFQIDTRFKFRNELMKFLVQPNIKTC